MKQQKTERASARKSTEQDIDFQPALTRAQVLKMDVDYNKTWGVKRRVMTGFLANSSAELIGRFKSVKDAGILITMVEGILDYRNHLLAGVQLAECAIDRLHALGDHLDKMFWKEGDGHE